MAQAKFSYTFQSPLKISSVNGHNALIVSFSSDIAYEYLEIRATKDGDPWGVGIGKLLASFSQTPANTQRGLAIYNTDLLQGDGRYRISFLAQDATGEWNVTTTLTPEFEFPFEAPRDGEGLIMGKLEVS